MTSLTGKTAATLAGTVKPPTISEALFGAVVQISVVCWVWARHTSFALCLESPLAVGCQADPWARQVCITIVGILVFWLVSLRTIPTAGTSDPSVVDRLWSVLPILYAWHFAASADEAARPRVVLMAVLVTAWGARLTYNFIIKGGYSGGEDYRWAEIRSWPGFDRGWELFNLLFICTFQQLAILAFSSPAAVALSHKEPLNAIDAIAAALYVALLLGEATADRQMLAFQSEKYRRIAAGEPLGAEYSHGFVRTGLWAYSRHPNYFCEVSIWWAFYIFSIGAGASLANWSLVGPVFLTCLFVLPRASLDVTETLSSRKYPAFADYQRRVSRFFPLPPRDEGELAPLSAGDAAFMGWFVVGIGITFLVDMEQVLVSSPRLYGVEAQSTPRWPPAPCVRAIHWWGHTADSLVLARPVWFQVAIWIEVLVQAPFYALALFAFSRRAQWIRLPAIG